MLKYRKTLFESSSYSFKTFKTIHNIHVNLFSQIENQRFICCTLTSLFFYYFVFGDPYKFLSVWQNYEKSITNRYSLKIAIAVQYRSDKKNSITSWFATIQSSCKKFCILHFRRQWTLFLNSHIWFLSKCSDPDKRSNAQTFLNVFRNNFL